MAAARFIVRGMVQVKKASALANKEGLKVIAHDHVNQGDKDFSSSSYQDNVCRQLNRDWLARHRIGYVFLPENRTQACISGMESLITSERIVFQAGDAYLLELSTP